METSTQPTPRKNSHSRRYVDPTGHRYGRLVVLETIRRSPPYETTCRCKCDCGNEVVRRKQNILRGDTQSCGCLHIETATKRISRLGFKHGMGHTTIGYAWSEIMKRCYNVNRPGYKDYGGRGIVPCDFVKASPVNLLLAVGEKPSPELSLDRIDNDMGYNCGVCAQCQAHQWKLNLRWATRTQQNRNSRHVHLVTINGVAKPISVWVEELGLTPYRVKKLHNSVYPTT